MKKVISLLTMAFCINAKAQCPPNISVNVPNPTSLTCNTPSIMLTGQSTNTNVTYSWNNSSIGIINSQSVNVTSIVGQYSLTVTDVSNSCSSTTVVTILQNFIAPVITSIAPILQNITCANPNIQTMTMTASNPTNNIAHIVSSPAIGGSLVVSNAPTAFYNPLPITASYDYWLLNTVTGCSTHATFSVLTTANMPTFAVTSTSILQGQGNYTVGCGNHSLTVINITNPNTNPTPGGGLQFGFIAPNSGTTYVPTSAQSTVVSTAGTWSIVVKSTSDNCEVRASVPIIQNTVSPNIAAIIPTQVLDCNTPNTTLTALTTNSNATFNWLTPLGSVPNQTVTASVTTNTASTSAGIYTLIVTDQDNGCSSNSVIPMQQNIFPPTASISATSHSLTCATPTIQLSNSSKTGIPLSSGFSTTSIIQVQLWQAPAPQPTAALVSSYFAYTPGTYTMTVKDFNNGCTSYTTINIGISIALQICEISTDSASYYNYNVLYWDNTPCISASVSVVDSFYIYRYDVPFGNYSKIATVPVNIAQYTDTARHIGSLQGTNGDPNYGSWKYTISSKNNTWGESPKSPYHLTEFLQNQQNGNFSISQYQIENTQTNPVTGYGLLRDDNNTGHYNLISTIPSGATSATDPQYSNFPNANYRVDIYGFNCNTANAKTTALVKAHSNTANKINTPTRINELTASNTQVKIYPNPANQILNVEVGSTNKNVQCSVYDVLGNEVINATINGSVTLDVSELKSGLYFVKVGSITKKFVKE